MPHLMTVRPLLLLSVFLGAGCAKPGASPNASQALTVIAVEASNEEKPASPPMKETVPPPDTADFKFRDDDSGKILAKILVPSAGGPIGFSPLTAAPSSRRLPIAVTNPEVPSAGSSATQALRLPSPVRVEPRPLPLPDRVPLELASISVAVPERPAMPVGPLTRIDVPDVKEPVPVPILARQTPDRAGFEDPTTEFTAQSIINDNLPLRKSTAGFVKINLPDPGENVEAAKVKTVVNQDPLKLIGDPPAPRP